MNRSLLASIIAAANLLILAASSANAVLVSYYPLDGDANAVVGPDGSIVGNPVFVPGQVGQGIDLDGNDFVNVGAGAIGGGSYSFAGFIRQDSDAGLQYIAGVQQSANNGGGLFRVNGGTPELRHVAPTGTVVGEAGNNVPAGNFVHVAATFNDELNEIRFYQDGVQIGGPVAATSNSSAVLQNFKIGQRPDNSNNDFNGVIDELAVYNHALTAGEVSTVFNSGVLALEAQRSTVGGNVVGPYVADSNTLSLYHLDEAAGDYVDSGSAGRDQNIVGGTRNTFAADGFGNSLTLVTPDLANNGLTKGATTADNLAQSNFQGADGAFTYEAVINVSTLENLVEQQMILTRENGGGTNNRSFQFRINDGNLDFVGINSTGVDNDNLAAIPTTGDHAFEANDWYHVAVTYDGQEGVAGNLSFYWTALQSDAVEANLIGTATLSADLIGNELGIFSIGTMRRNAFRAPLLGSIDEVRISDIARGAGDFLFQAQIPEPTTATLGLIGLAGMMVRRQRCA